MVTSLLMLVPIELLFVMLGQPSKLAIGPIRLGKFNTSGVSFRAEALDANRRAEILDNYAGHLSTDGRERLGQQLFHFSWLGTVHVDADHLLAAEAAALDRRAARMADHPATVAIIRAASIGATVSTPAATVRATAPSRPAPATVPASTPGCSRGGFHGLN
jgi:hypothetical protein